MKHSNASVFFGPITRPIEKLGLGCVYGCLFPLVGLPYLFSLVFFSFMAVFENPDSIRWSWPQQTALALWALMLVPYWSTRLYHKRYPPNPATNQSIYIRFRVGFLLAIVAVVVIYGGPYGMQRAYKQYLADHEAGWPREIATDER